MTDPFQELISEVIFYQKWHVKVDKILKVTNLLLPECSKNNRR
jgi:hypothetical protein